jgi:hypothetical protein
MKLQESLLVGLALAAGCAGVGGCNNPRAEAGRLASVRQGIGLEGAPLPVAASTTAAKPAPGKPAAGQGPLAGDTGYYVGMFEAEEMDDAKNPMYSNKINISLDALSTTQVAGHSVVAGNLRPFSGTVSSIGAGQYELVAKEPGDDKYDGVFSCTLDTAAHTLKGTWQANDKHLAVTRRSYDLTRTEFKYNPAQALGTFEAEVYDTEVVPPARAEAITEDAGKFNASVRLLKARDVENLYKRDLEVMRNAIYARHGYSFQNRQMRNFFDSYVDWYIPVSIDVTAELTDVEKKNIELLKRYEQHASSYYDHFGR